MRTVNLLLNCAFTQLHGEVFIFGSALSMKTEQKYFDGSEHTHSFLKISCVSESTRIFPLQASNNIDLPPLRNAKPPKQYDVNKSDFIISQSSQMISFERSHYRDNFI